MAKKITLVQSPVIFNEEQHTYRYCEMQLSGITGIISKYLFPDMYKGVNKTTLANAASHGHLVHSQIQDIVNNKVKFSSLAEAADLYEPEVFNYLHLMKVNKIKMLCSEYLVSDLENIASSIDLVDKDLNLYDIKTTSEFHREYVRWQLSIYAYLFELQNPGRKAGKLYGIHLRDGAKLIEVERIADDVVKKLLDAYVSGSEEFDNPLNTLGEDEESMMLELEFITNKKKELEAREKELKDTITKRMKDGALYSIRKDTWSVTRTPDSYTKKFDEKALLAAKPNIWRKFLKDSKTSGRLTITFAK